MFLLKKVKKVYWCIRFDDKYLPSWRAYIISFLKKWYLVFFWRILRRISRPSKVSESFIISLTSYPPRFNCLRFTLYSLISQSVRPDAIVLCIAHADIELLPRGVKILIDQGLVHLIPTEDLGPGKKIIPLIERYPDSFIFTADDDLYYDRNWLRELFCNWDGNYKHVVANKVHKITFDSFGHMRPYREWEHNTDSLELDPCNFATGCGGVMYPPHCLNAKVTDVDLYRRYAFYQDDIWLFWMLRMNHGLVVPTRNKFHEISWGSSQKSALALKNLYGNENDECIDRMTSIFGNPLDYSY